MKNFFLAGAMLLLSGVVLKNIAPVLSSHLWDGRFFFLGYEEIWLSFLPILFSLFSFIGVGAVRSIFSPLKRDFIKGRILSLLIGAVMWVISGFIEESLFALFVAFILVGIMLSFAADCSTSEIED